MDGEKNLSVQNRIFGHKKNVVLSFEVKRTELYYTLLDQMSQAHKESCPKFSLMCGNLEIALGKQITNFSCKTYMVGEIPACVCDGSPGKIQILLKLPVVERHPTYVPGISSDPLQEHYMFSTAQSPLQTLGDLNGEQCALASGKHIGKATNDYWITQSQN